MPEATCACGAPEKYSLNHQPFGWDYRNITAQIRAALATAPVQAGTGAQEEAWAASIHKVPLTPEAKQRRAERLRAAQPTEHEQGEEGGR